MTTRPRIRGTARTDMRARLARHLLTGVIVAVLLGAGAPLLGGQTAHADGRPPGGRFDDPLVRAVDIAQPAVVRLATLYSAHITLALCGHQVTLPSSGPGYILGGTGSGAFISSNGDILTADHVVDLPRDALDQEVFQDPRAAADMASAVNAYCRVSQPITATDIESGFIQYVGIAYSTSYSPPHRLAWMDTAFTGPVSSASQEGPLQGLMAAKSYDVTVLSTSSFSEDDLAIVHVPLSDTPSIQLDDSAQVAVDDQLTIIGFPGNGDVTNTSTDLLTPSVNSIQVSAIKTGDNGASLIQVGGNVEHGDSGDPALDSAGHIVGVVSFGGPDPRGTTAFLRASDSARALIAQAGVDTHRGSFETLWEEAFSDYAAAYPGHWHRAAQELDALSTRYPAFQGVQPFRIYADQAALVETTPFALSDPRVLIGAAALGLVLLGVLVVLAVSAAKRRRRTRQAGPLAGMPGYASPATVPPAYPGSPSPMPGTYGAMPSLPASASRAGLSGPYAAPGWMGDAWSNRQPSGPVPPQGQNGHAQTSPNGYAGTTGPPPQTSGKRWPMAGSGASGPASPSVIWSGPPGGAQPATGATSRPWGSPAGPVLCPNGHPVSAHEVYCPVCGMPCRQDVPPISGSPLEWR
jgi:hypothetical protein